MTILINNLRRIFGKPINIILMIVVPLVLNIFFISVSSGSQKYTIGVIDYDDSKLTQLILAELEDEAEIVDIEDDEDAIKAALINRALSIYKFSDSKELIYKDPHDYYKLFGTNRLGGDCVGC